MQRGTIDKYRPFPQIDLPDRAWPNRTIDRAPIWCSVDLRDGNQALINPMNLEQKLSMFSLLVDIGFKEIEVGFPSAAAVEFDFTRTLIDNGLIPEGVYPQVLTQARDHLIRRTFQAIEGTPQAIVHLYNSTSELQRRVVFRKDRAAIRQIAVDGTRLVRELADRTDTDVVYEYSPESFTGTELDYVVEVCDAVIEAWDPSPDRRIIINLPATVELATPNVYADQIEWFLRNVQRHDSIILSLHTHNDRGTGVAATELGMLAGGERVEGTLFGNGERTGNVDIVTVALNLYTQGVDPGLDLSDLGRLIGISDACTELPIDARHPYAGELVFTAFSGSHQDAINKGMTAQGDGLWEVPYLPLDPTDIGRSYQAIIRINSQSGKGGVAYVMEAEFGCQLPKTMQPEMGEVVQELTDRTGREVNAAEIWERLQERIPRSRPADPLPGLRDLQRPAGQLTHERPPHGGDRGPGDGADRQRQRTDRRPQERARRSGLGRLQAHPLLRARPGPGHRLHRHRLHPGGPQRRHAALRRRHPPEHRQGVRAGADLRAQPHRIGRRPPPGTQGGRASGHLT